MFYTRATFIGIDPTAGVRPFTYAALDADLQLLALGEGSLEEVTAFAGGQREAVVSVNAPFQPNQRRMADSQVRESLQPVPHPGRWMDYRVAEYELYQHNISIPRTPHLVEDCPRWMQMGFLVFHRLQKMGFQTYPADGANCQTLETYPHGGYCALLGRIPFPKHTLEGRIQRQLVLHDRQVKLTNPMLIFEEITRYRLLNGILPLESLHTAQELDALLAAFTAWTAAYHPHELALLGDPEEGQIALPGAPLKQRYS